MQLGFQVIPGVVRIGQLHAQIVQVRLKERQARFAFLETIVQFGRRAVGLAQGHILVLHQFACLIQGGVGGLVFRPDAGHLGSTHLQFAAQAITFLFGRLQLRGQLRRTRPRLFQVGLERRDVLVQRLRRTRGVLLHHGDPGLTLLNLPLQIPNLSLQIGHLPTQVGHFCAAGFQRRGQFILCLIDRGDLFLQFSARRAHRGQIGLGG